MENARAPPLNETLGISMHFLKFKILYNSTGGVGIIETTYTGLETDKFHEILSRILAHNTLI